MSESTSSKELAKLLSGRWKGTGEVLRGNGSKPSVPYVEEAEFSIIKDAPDAVIYRTVSSTHHAEQEFPMHNENGFIKVLRGQENDDEWHIEAAFTHPFANSMVNEMSFGKVDKKEKALILEAPDAEHFQRAIPVPEGGQGITGYKRVYRRDGDKLLYDHYLSFGGNELYHHLTAKLEHQE